MKNFKGKAIYNPSGKAGEYSYWACNFYVGCSNGCTYCYCKKGLLAKAMGHDKPQLKKCFKNGTYALSKFKEEVDLNMKELERHGLFFSFTTDPMLPETILLTKSAAEFAVLSDVAVKILTKKVDWVDTWIDKYFVKVGNPRIFETKHLWAFGFTLTGHDDLEPNASTNTERIQAMRTLHDAGFKTFASLEPIIDFDSSWKMIIESFPYCDLFKIGLESGKKYNKYELIKFIESINLLFSDLLQTKVYFKDSLLKAAGINRADLPENCVSRDYNIFNQQIRKHELPKTI